MSKTVYLSPSTQQNNIGADDYGTEEYRCNLIADITEKELIRHEITVYRNKTTMSVYDIVADSNRKKPDIHYAIHTNAYNKKARGCEVYCWQKGIGSEGEKLANATYLQLSKITPTSDRGVKNAKNLYGTGKHIYEIHKTTAAAVLSEIAFHDNKDDAEWIINNIELIGSIIAISILNYFGIKFIPAAAPSEAIFYRVICGSFHNKDNALLQVKKLEKLGVPCFLEAKKLL